MALVRQLAESAVERFIEVVVDRWEFAREQDIAVPDVQVIFEQLAYEGYHVPMNAFTLNYLQRCKWECSVPDRRTLHQLLLSWNPLMLPHI